MEDLSKCLNDKDLSLFLNEKIKDENLSKSFFLLLKDVCDANRANCALLEEKDKISGSKDIDEYILYDYDRQRENKFQEIKKNKGSKFAFFK